MAHEHNYRRGPQKYQMSKLCRSESSRREIVRRQDRGRRNDGQSSKYPLVHGRRVAYRMITYVMAAVDALGYTTTVENLPVYLAGQEQDRVMLLDFLPTDPVEFVW